jgi:hypothetical protein
MNADARRSDSSPHDLKESFPGQRQPSGTSPPPRQASSRRALLAPMFCSLHLGASNAKSISDLAFLECLLQKRQRNSQRLGPVLEEGVLRCPFVELLQNLFAFVNQRCYGADCFCQFHSCVFLHAGNDVSMVSNLQLGQRSNSPTRRTAAVRRVGWSWWLGILLVWHFRKEFSGCCVKKLCLAAGRSQSDFGVLVHGRQFRDEKLGGGKNIRPWIRGAARCPSSVLPSIPCHHLIPNVPAQSGEHASLDCRRWLAVHFSRRIP